MITCRDEAQGLMFRLNETRGVLCQGAMTFPKFTVDCLIIHITKMENELSNCCDEWKMSRSDYYMGK